jgi:hypothetical protein
MDQARTVTATFAAQEKMVTLVSSKNKVLKGKKVTLRATVAPCPGHEGDTVEFFKGSKSLGSVATDQACTASIKRKIKKKSVFTAASPQQDQDHLAGTSPPVTVKVKKPA